MRKIKWSVKAQQDRRSIFTYWNKRNQSDSYSKKLNEKFRERIKLLARYPEIGTTSGIEGIHTKLADDYWIFYSFSDTEVIILQISSTYQNPEQFNKEL